MPEHGFDPKKTFMRELISWGKYIVSAILIGLMINFFVKTTIVSGMSMYPTLNNGDYLLVNRMAYEFSIPQRGDIVVFKSHLSDGRYLIKRVIAVEGERVEIKQGNVYVNGYRLNEPYIRDAFTDGELSAVVPQGSIFVLGDNRANSLDSRHPSIGFVSLEDVIGKVVVRIFPIQSFQWLNDAM